MTMMDRIVEIWNESGSLPYADELGDLLGTTEISARSLVSLARRRGLLPPESKHKRRGARWRPLRRAKEISQVEADLELLRRVLREPEVAAAMQRGGERAP
jgi:hypothetical protein